MAPRRNRKRGAINVKVSGVQACVRNLVRFNKTLNKEMKKITRRHGEKLYARVVGGINSRSGKLARSVFRAETDSGFGVTVGTHLYYAQYVEFGWRKRFAFLYPALKVEARLYKRNVRRNTKKVLGETNKRVKRRRAS